jgi:hypothetical protein
LANDCRSAARRSLRFIARESRSTATRSSFDAALTPPVCRQRFGYTLYQTRRSNADCTRAADARLQSVGYSGEKKCQHTHALSNIAGEIFAAGITGAIENVDGAGLTTTANAESTTA